ncbi:CinA family protein [Phenylobacterium terrae]|uniref:CinA family protein n=1 Tax=Phenylobacterium terrae TaxID=2665495 RepID=A0ABW4MVX3_9CAUL
MSEALEPALPGWLDELTNQVLEEACRRELKLATAESCTGGLLASLLTDVPGCSHAFERGFVTYTEEAKHELLGVPRAVLETDGAVSEACARAMAEGALAASRADIAVAVTGFADDSTDPKKPGGLVHFAAARRGGPTLHRKEEFGPRGRAAIRLECLRVCLELVRDQVARPLGAAAE